MNVLLTILLAVQILAALGMIGLILMQHGKGADAGAAFGGGGAGSASLFGASGGANFLSRTTGVLAAIFLASTLGLAYFGNLRQAPTSSGSVLEGGALPAQAPAAAQIPDAASGQTTVPAVVDAQPAGTGAAQIPGK
jgi:preprotein translocase subunit SecG